ncbi:MAG: PIG-L family deacetylase [Candidatus Sulfobium sp.]|jgi:LmbE family N-acetylglucosaminyl deacetylase
MNTLGLDMREFSRALFLAPHPDDEALGCSGTLKLLDRAGTELTLVFLSNGEKLYGEASAEIAEVRKKEAISSAQLLGCNDTIFLDFPDGEIGKYSQEIFLKLAGIVEERKPEVVFAPSPIDYHDDHIAASHIGLRLLETSGPLRLALYEVYSTLRFNCLVDITGTAGLKKQAILNYRTSLYGKPELYVDAALGLNAHRSIFVQRKGFFEAFYLMEKAEPLDSILRFFCYTL